VTFEPFYLTNRIAIVILPKAPFVEWINATDPAQQTKPLTLESAREEPSAFLIPLDDADDSDEFGKQWMQRNWRLLFEHVLDEWYVDSDLWPRNRTVKMFREWCDVQMHSMVFDWLDSSQP
jgi:hypothetical protein